MGSLDLSWLIHDNMAPVSIINGAGFMPLMDTMIVSSCLGCSAPPAALSISNSSWLQVPYRVLLVLAIGLGMEVHLSGLYILPALVASPTGKPGNSF